MGGRGERKCEAFLALILVRFCLGGKLPFLRLSPPGEVEEDEPDGAKDEKGVRLHGDGRGRREEWRRKKRRVSQERIFFIKKVCSYWSQFKRVEAMRGARPERKKRGKATREGGWVSKHPDKESKLFLSMTWVVFNQICFFLLRLACHRRDVVFRVACVLGFRYL